MDKPPLWTMPTDGNGNQSVLDRVLHGLQPRIQVDKRTEEIKAQETANAMEMLKRGQILALSHDPIGTLAGDTPEPTERSAKTGQPKTDKKSKAGRPSKKPVEPVEPENDDRL